MKLEFVAQQYSRVNVTSFDIKIKMLFCRLYCKMKIIILVIV